MLRCVPTSSPLENFSAEIVSVDMSVLERQRALLQRLYQEQQFLNPSPSSSSGGSAMPLFQCQNFMNPSIPIHPSIEDNSQNFGFTCSEITTTATTNVSANSSREQHPVSTKKRKAQFEAESNNLKDKKAEGVELESGITVKSEKGNSGKISRENSKASEVVQKTEYIHVRARRGQATDSHSLAERARREKISKKMKCLQDLVPGCNKVTGKAGMLDEIINYVQSLQKQVEFLSMKLASLNPRLDFNIDNFVAKEIPAYVSGFPTSVTQMEVVHSALVQYNQGQQESSSSGLDLASNNPTRHHQMLPQKTATSTMLFPEAYLDSLSNLSQIQQLSNLDSDWQSLFSVGFH